jgi:hypothetical protein
VDDDADGQAQELIDAAHPLGIAFGEVVVDGDDVDAFAFERIQIDGQPWRPAFCLRRSSFRRSALVQHHAADQLDVEVAHVEDAAAGFAATAKASIRMSSSVAPGESLFESMVLAARSMSEAASRARAR